MIYFQPSPHEEPSTSLTEEVSIDDYPRIKKEPISLKTGSADLSADDDNQSVTANTCKVEVSSTISDVSTAMTISVKREPFDSLSEVDSEYTDVKEQEPSNPQADSVETVTKEDLNQTVCAIEIKHDSAEAIKCDAEESSTTDSDETSTSDYEKTSTFVSEESSLSDFEEAARIDHSHVKPEISTKEEKIEVDEGLDDSFDDSLLLEESLIEVDSVEPDEDEYLEEWTPEELQSHTDLIDHVENASTSRQDAIHNLSRASSSSSTHTAAETPECSYTGQPSVTKQPKSGKQMFVTFHVATHQSCKPTIGREISTKRSSHRQLPTISLEPGDYTLTVPHNKQDKPFIRLATMYHEKWNQVTDTAPPAPIVYRKHPPTGVFRTIDRSKPVKIYKLEHVDIPSDGSFSPIPVDEIIINGILNENPSPVDVCVEDEQLITIDDEEEMDVDEVICIDECESTEPSPSKIRPASPMEEPILPPRFPRSPLKKPSKIPSLFARPLLKPSPPPFKISNNWHNIKKKNKKRQQRPCPERRGIRDEKVVDSYAQGLPCHHF